MPGAPFATDGLYRVPSPAKINLFLHVTGRRPDGYHELQTAFRFVGLCDHLDFERRDDGRILRLNEGLPGLAPEDDLAVRAACLLQQASGCRHGVQIRYDKQIPAGGGLGGGSSNAATTLMALNRLWQTGLGRDDLMALGARLGADVPVFIFGQPAFAQGRGDSLSPIALPDAHYVIICPPLALATAEVFAHPDLTRNTKSITIALFTEWLKGHLPGQSGLFGHNDLQRVACLSSPELGSMVDTLLAQGHAIRMTGSGSCFFVECESARQARMIRQQILGKIPATLAPGAAREGIWQVWACPGLHAHPLQSWVKNAIGE